MASCLPNNEMQDRADCPVRPGSHDVFGGFWEGVGPWPVKDRPNHSRQSQFCIDNYN
jgi:hypothetical protein